MDINNLTKMQLVLLVLLVSFVTSFVTGIVTVALVEQAPPPITQTIQKVVERVKEFPAQIIEQKLSESKGEVNGKVIVITQEDQVINIVQNSFPAVVSVMASEDALLTEKQQAPTGTGFFVSANGLVITNHHAIEDREVDYSVLLNNGKNYAAKVLARDPVRDLAILKIDGSGFAFLALGNSGLVKTGQTVIAIGNALDEFKNTVSVGVISGFGHSITVSSTSLGFGYLQEVIQTDAVIGPENYGGPLLDLAGNVIGINTAAALGAKGIGFALSVNVVKKAIDEVEFLRAGIETENEIKLEKQPN